jgi:hypothetical protein
MKQILIASALGSLTSLCIAQVSHTASQPWSPDRVTIFQVPLGCPAAPQIGCGSSAKPILLELERDPEVAEAWLNRAGTQIAVVWKSNSKAGNAAGKLKSQLSAAGCCTGALSATELEGISRNAALKDFQFGGWYRGADVDRLSEEEAAIIAARLVGRVQAKTRLAKGKVERLREALREAFSKCLIAGSGKEIHQFEIDKIAGQFLDERQTIILQEAVKGGLRPHLNER